ncbi:hypothetical protein AB0933_08890 [Streptomyces venezuelae]
MNADLKVVKSGLGSRFEATQGRDSQVLRKATIQATFKDLHDHEKRTNPLMVRPETATGDTPDWSRISAELTSRAYIYAEQSWVLGRDRLNRGDLIEIDVNLRADATFRVSSIISTMSDLVSNPHLAASIDPEDMQEAQAINEILESLMAGLVPLKCRMVDYSAYVINGVEYAIHRKLEPTLPESVKLTRKSLYVVGVTEQSLYWKDIRRVLFSDSPVRILCRIGTSGIQSRWTPIKLSEVLKEIIPDLANEIDRFSAGALGTFSSGSQSEEVTGQRVRVLALYGELIARRYGLTLDSDARERIENLARSSSGLLVSVTDSRRAFNLITQDLESQFSISVDPGDAANDRDRSWRLIGVTPGGIALSASNASRVQATPAADERYIDSEFVAIYW